MEVYLLPELLKQNVKKLINDVDRGHIMSEMTIGKAGKKLITISVYSEGEAKAYLIDFEQKDVCIEVKE